MEIEINIKISIFKEIYSEKKFANYEKYRTCEANIMQNDHQESCTYQYEVMMNQFLL